MKHIKVFEDNKFSRATGFADNINVNSKIASNNSNSLGFMVLSLDATDEEDEEDEEAEETLLHSESFPDPTSAKKRYLQLKGHISNVYLVQIIEKDESI